MDPKEFLVLIKQEDLTEDVDHIAEERDRTAVTFKGGKTYRYAKGNVCVFMVPEVIRTTDKLVLVAGDLLTGVQAVLRFSYWAKIFYRSGTTRICLYADLSLEEQTSSKGRSKDILAYFNELARDADLRTDKGESILALKYQQMEMVSRRSVLASYLKHSLPPAESDPAIVLFPFGCNKSQKTAVYRALQYPVSVIQGPPGTGKTQTILNLLGNLLLMNKTVVVASNNNAAIANVSNKMEAFGLDFTTAFLGSSQNKKAFIEGQEGEHISMPILNSDELTILRKSILELNAKLDGAFEAQNEQATTVQKIDAVKHELARFEAFFFEEYQNDEEIKELVLPRRVSKQKLMDTWLICERLARRRGVADPHSRINKYGSGDVSRWQRFRDRIQLLSRLGLSGRLLFALTLEERISVLQRAYYRRELVDLEIKRKALEKTLAGFDFNNGLRQLTENSMCLLKHRLGERYNDRERTLFDEHDLKGKPNEFLREYPIVLSTTFSAITSVTSGFVFDYMIVDEASQVDLLTGALAMSCAKKLVIVGDPMQLPNVISSEVEDKARKTAERFDVPDFARFETNSLLSSVMAAFENLPVTLLREHYRCHPKIIQFCNQKFYGNKLVVMTKDGGEPDVLKAYVTVKGHHARGTINQRQVDEIVEYVLPELGAINRSEIGIVSPFRAQAMRMRSTVGSEAVEIDTVHKYQGREKQAIVITTVANESNDFVENPHLLNVAVSRAKEKLRVVVSGDMAEGGGNVADLIRYIRYSNGEVVSGRVRSIFDFLYQEYTEARLKLLAKRRAISKYDSENLAFIEIDAVLRESEFQNYGSVFQFPLSALVRDKSEFTAEEYAYATHPWTHIDFVVYRRTDRSPVLAIEIDGYSFHRKGTRHAERDDLKNSVLRKCELPLLRLSTTGSNEKERIRKALNAAASAYPA